MDRRWEGRRLNIGFIGAGNMGSMLIRALVGSGALRAEQVVVSNRSPEKVSRLTDELPGLQAGSNADVARRCGTVFLCTRPVEAIRVLGDIHDYISPQHLLVTITNSIDIAELEGAVRARVAKVIPSLTQTVGAGVSLIMFGERVPEDDRVSLRALLARISRPFVISEEQARVASDLTSCGPAFLAYVYLALARAAQRCRPDLPLVSAEAMVLQTAVATAKLLQETGLSLEEVIQTVSTPGGITAEGLRVLDQHLTGVWEQVIETTIAKEHGKKVHIEL